MKLMDFALSSDVFAEDYETVQTENGEERRPLKFMAIESISDRRFSTASDVVRHQRTFSSCIGSVFGLFSSGLTAFCFGN